MFLTYDKWCSILQWYLHYIILLFVRKKTFQGIVIKIWRKNEISRRRDGILFSAQTWFLSWRIFKYVKCSVENVLYTTYKRQWKVLGILENLFYLLDDLSNKHFLFGRIFCTDLYSLNKSPKSLSWRTYGHNGWYIQLHVYKIKILQFPRFSVQSSLFLSWKQYIFFETKKLIIMYHLYSCNFVK